VISAANLLSALRRQLKALEDDIREHLDEQPTLDATLRADWQAAGDANRVASAYPQWRDEEITQAAVHWVLACVFLRFIEDNGLVDRPWLSGATPALRDLAQDRHEQYFQHHPLHSDRDYLLQCFEDAAALPALGGLFDRAHNPLWRIAPSGDGAMAVLGLWQAVDPDTGEVRFDFRVERPSPPAPLPKGEGRKEGLAPRERGWAEGKHAEPSPPRQTGWDEGTRFLGDLYQDLSEPVRQKYALLQTPEFVEEFILDRTLTPAIRELGYREVRMIDPTCGSGHFLLGAFRRLFDLWAANEPARNLPDLVQQAINAVHGVDINPYAVAIARFRLIVAALAAAGVRHLKDAPDFKVQVAVGDSLLHGRRFTQLDLGGEADLLAHTNFGHAFATEDLEAVNRILGQRYHVVVGNPPYITVKDAALNALYRQLYPDTCHMKYALVVPFTERFFIVIRRIPYSLRHVVRIARSTTEHRSSAERRHSRSYGSGRAVHRAIQ
jgi:hypothetical protein